MDLALNTPPPTKPKLLLVDGTSIVRRVWEAVRGEDTPERAQGAMTSSWGSFMRALREHEPTHFLAAFDYGGQTWRHRLYARYKEDRKPTSANLTDALPAFFERLNSAGMRTLSIPDVEADDTVATLALKSVARGFEVVLLAADKDMLKLINDGVNVYDHFQSEWRDEAWVMNRFGIKPSQMTDLLALMGDDSDGIPGIHKVGLKTAAKLLTEYGDLESVLADGHAIKGNLGERIRSGVDVARLSHALATLKSDVALGITPRDIQLPAALLAEIKAMPAPKLVRTSPMIHQGAHQQAHPGPLDTRHIQNFQQKSTEAAPRRLRM